MSISDCRSKRKAGPSLTARSAERTILLHLRAMEATSNQPLAGLTVLELGQIYNGPYCGLLLAHHGADVIKIESPQGDVLRRMDRSPGGASYPFLMLNANKRGVTINLKHARGRAVFLDLAEQADIIVENFAAGVMERLDISYDVVAARNPRIIFASGSACWAQRIS